MIDKPTPTDAEIIAVAATEGVRVRTGAAAIKFARAVLAKWGTPQPAPDCHHRPPCDECAAIAARGGKV